MTAGRKERIIDGDVFDARIEAAQIVEAARREAAELRAAARVEGFEAGRQAGLAQIAEAEVARTAAAERRLDDHKDELVRLAVAIAEKLLRRQLTLAPEAVADVAAEALALARGRRAIVVRVHPEDLGRVAARLPGVTVRADDAVGRGGCLVDTEAGRIDARLETQLAAIERGLRRR